MPGICDYSCNDCRHSRLGCSAYAVGRRVPCEDFDRHQATRQLTLTLEQADAMKVQLQEAELRLKAAMRILEGL